MRKRFNFVFITEETHLSRERKGYYNALYEEKQNVKHLVIKQGEKIPQNKIHADDIIIWGDQGPIPRNLFDFPNLKIAFHIDTFSDTSFKLELTTLFDLNIVFHFEYESYFKEKHPNQQVIFLPHAIEKKHIAGDSILKSPRKYEVAFAGDIKRPQYSVRKKMVEHACQNFHTNDVSISLPYEKMMELYKQTKIVLNIPRNDYLKDGNLRAFEAMASGAVLCNYTPTELTQIGFEAGKDFVGFSSKEELKVKIDEILQNSDLLNEIAKNGYVKTLTQNTYNSRVQKMLNYLNNNNFSLNNKRPNKTYIFALQALKNRNLQPLIKEFLWLVIKFEVVNIFKLNRIVLQRLFNSK